MWFGGESTNVKWMQINMRSSTALGSGGDDFDWKELNRSQKDVHDRFCNTPSRMRTLNYSPERGIVITDEEAKGNRTEVFSAEEVATNHKNMAAVIIDADMEERGSL